LLSLIFKKSSVNSYNAHKYYEKTQILKALSLRSNFDVLFQTIKLLMATFLGTTTTVLPLISKQQLQQSSEPS